jgi:hypothetical protein
VRIFLARKEKEERLKQAEGLLIPFKEEIDSGEGFCDEMV